MHIYIYYACNFQVDCNRSNGRIWTVCVKSNPNIGEIEVGGLVSLLLLVAGDYPAHQKHQKWVVQTLENMEVWDTIFMRILTFGPSLTQRFRCFNSHQRSLHCKHETDKSHTPSLANHLPPASQQRPSGNLPLGRVGDFCFPHGWSSSRNGRLAFSRGHKLVSSMI